jgi:adenylate cyclase
MAVMGFNRKLSAILSADVKGYSRLMGSDEEATVRTITLYRELIAGLVGKNNGRIVDSPGDNILVEFASVVHAMQCGFEIQAALEVENAKLPKDRRMEFRIGINLGDVIEDGGRIYGDGVNVAARLEALAEAGGICIAGNVYDQIENKFALGCIYLGEKTVKNIATPVRVYGVWSDPASPGCRVKKLNLSPSKRLGFVSAVFALCLSAGALWMISSSQQSTVPHPTSGLNGASPAAASGKTSIAVLPFKNLSADNDQEYFSDGLTNDIITDLSKFHELVVISAESVFKFKNEGDNIEHIGRQLAVRYVLRGSVQKAGGEVRINVGLVEAASNSLLWSERYVRGMKDIFTLQNEIVQTIVANLAVKISAAERFRTKPSETQNLQAYDYLLQGYKFHFNRTLAANVKAGEMFEKAIALDPNYAAAYIGLGKVEFEKAIFGWTEFSEKSLSRARELAQKALSLDDSNAAAHHLLARIFAARAQYELALSELERALELNPNDADSYEARGWIMLWSGRTDEAIDSLKFALRLGSNPKNTLLHLGTAYYLKERYQDAITTLEKGAVQWPEFSGLYLMLAAAYAQIGRMDAAAKAAAEVHRLDPFFSPENYGKAFTNQQDRQRIIFGLQKAGLS